MTKKIVICLLGNSGCGKTTLSQLINSTTENFIVIERDNQLDVEYDINLTIIDELTLEYPFNYEKFNEVKLIDQTKHGENIYWIILDCQIEEILRRISSRSNRNEYQSEKALNYYQERYRHLSSHFGIPLLNTTNQTLNETFHEIINLIQIHSLSYQYFRRIGTQILTLDYIEQNNIEYKLSQLIKDDHFDLIDDLPEYANEFEQIDQHLFYTRWYLNHHSIEINHEKSLITIGDYQILINGIIFQLINEGESKKIYRDITNNPLTKNLVFIILKSTIYSHSMQLTGEINQLNSIRAFGSQIFLEMIWRNNFKHSYRSINSNGIIISDFIDSIPPIEIIVKRFCQGTDFHSFYHIQNYENIVKNNGEYQIGPYVRFDWRNPNHISPKTKKSLYENPYYYLYEQIIGKQEFFQKILMNKQYAIPMGDRNISEDLLSNIINVKSCKQSALKLFTIIQSYFSRVNLLIKDVCFMLDKNGKYFFNEINQDSMRITTNDSEQNIFDKDIWRSARNNSRDEIINKWTVFNRIFENYFNKNRFHQTEMIEIKEDFYQNDIRCLLTNQQLNIPSNLKDIWINIREKYPRRILVSLDLFNGKPVLVQTSKIYQFHSNEDYRQAIQKLSLFSDILIVDLDRAFQNQYSKNREIIKELAKEYNIHTGGGLRSLNDLDEMLKSGVRRCIIATADDSIIKQIPKDRLIIEMSINENNEILIDGRRTNTHMNILDRIKQLIHMNIDVISITFVQTEGHLLGIPRQQIEKLLRNIPMNIRKIYIGGGICSYDDLEYLWSFSRVIPLIGSAIWTNRLTIGKIYNQMIYFNHQGIVPSIIQDRFGLVKGLCYMNELAIEKTCEERILYRYSRKFQNIILKGQSSNNIQRVIQINLDCDSDSILITVDSKKPFCHTDNYSCFHFQRSIKYNIGYFIDYIKSRMNMNTYSGQMQRNPQLTLMKIFEEYWEIVASNNINQISECTDFLFHFIVYLNGMNISIENIFNQLNIRRWSIRNLSPQFYQIHSKEIIIGITICKYTNKTDLFAREQLGIEIIRSHGRNFSVRAQIIDQEKFYKYFQCQNLTIFPCKPKDMGWLLASKRLTHIITYQTTIENSPKIYSLIHQIVDPSLCLALICRKGTIIQPDQWTSDNKTLIATEYICQVTKFFDNISIDRRTYHLDKVTGSTEAFLVNSDKYLLVDAIVETGTTLEENHLQIWKVIIPKGQLHIGLYQQYYSQINTIDIN